MSETAPFDAALFSPGEVVLLGLPYDAGSSFLRGPAYAPPRIREALHSGSANLCAEDGRDLDGAPDFHDGGDLPLPQDPSALDRIAEAAGTLAARGARILALGGDHSVTYPLVRGLAPHIPALTLLHLDAHPDLYDHYEGDRLSHACPFARIMEAGLVRRLVQVGIRTMNPHQRRQAERFGVEVIDMLNWRPDLDLALEGPLYVSLDLDVFDPGFAPGVSHHEPGGLSPREVINLLHRLPVPVFGADVVEYNPRRDPSGITAMLAAKLTRELAALMLRGR